MYIRATKNVNDNKYYILAYVVSNFSNFSFIVNFLVDTGASSTTISWFDALNNKIDIKNLPKVIKMSQGIGGSVNKYILPDSMLIFASDSGWFNYPLSDLHVSDFEDPEGKRLPIITSYIGMNILGNFSFYKEDNYIFLVKKSI